MKAGTMREFRCPHPHPTRQGQVCNRLLLRGRFEGEIELQCHRCCRRVVLDMRAAYTAAQVDKVLAAL